MLIRDKTGGPLLQADLEAPVGDKGAPILVADNGRKSFEIDAQHAAQFYKLISATKKEVESLTRAGFRMDCSDEFEARDG